MMQYPPNSQSRGVRFSCHLAPSQLNTKRLRNVGRAKSRQDSAVDRLHWKQSFWSWKLFCGFAAIAGGFP
jgi:hypothetical protein